MSATVSSSGGATPEAPQVAAPRGLEKWFHPLNPLFAREMRQHARIGRTPWYLLAISICITLGLAFIGGISVSTGVDPGEIGEILFQTYFTIATCVVFLVGPAVAANTVASEREGRTWEAILLTGLRTGEIMRGKLYSSATMLAIYIVFLAPAGALSFLFGGVTAIEVLLSFVVLSAIALVTVAFGLAVSSSSRSTRAALILSLLLAVILGITLFSTFGIGLSFWAHQSWPNVPRGHPIWLPLAWTRAKISWSYAGHLVALPVLLFVASFWFLYEYAHSNLTDDTDDRMGGLKRWFVVNPLFHLVGGAILVASTTSSNDAIAISGMIATGHLFYVFFSAMLFAAEAPAPSRRLLVRWRRDGAGTLRRWFGPNLAATSFFQLLVLVGGVLVAMVMGVAKAAPSTPDLLKAVAFVGYLTLFSIFPIGMIAWMRSRGGAPMRTRAVTFAAIALASAVPWVLAAVGGVFTSMRGDWLAIASPSPFFAIAMAGAVGQAEEGLYLGAGFTCAALWALAGILFLGFALRRNAAFRAEREAFFAREEVMLAEEAKLRAHAVPSTPPAMAGGEVVSHEP